MVSKDIGAPNLKPDAPWSPYAHGLPAQVLAAVAARGDIPLFALECDLPTNERLKQLFDAAEEAEAVREAGAGAERPRGELGAASARPGSRVRRGQAGGIGLQSACGGYCRSAGQNPDVGFLTWCIQMGGECVKFGVRPLFCLF
jgi:hypothetical protein